jgi:hypothetical protein
MKNISPVTLDLFALEALAQDLAEQELAAPQWREPWYPQGDDETFVQFLGVANALNFCYTEPRQEKFQVNWNDMPLSGSTGLMAALMRAREEGTDVLDADVLARLTNKDIDRIFRSDAGPLPLMPFRDTYIRSLGRELRVYAGGSFLNLFKACGFDAKAIMHMLTECFIAYGGDSYALADGTEVRFDKRARLLPLMYEGRARSSDGKLPTLKSVEAIGPVIDYQVAKTLHERNVLLYTANLDGMIRKEVPLEPWGLLELGIRLHAHRAVELLLERINQIRTRREQEPITMVELDYALWSAGRAYKDVPHHICMTTAY